MYRRDLMTYHILLTPKSRTFIPDFFISLKSSKIEYAPILVKWLCPNCKIKEKYFSTVLQAKSDSDVMVCLQSYHGLITDISHVY